MALLAYLQNQTNNLVLFLHVIADVPDSAWGYFRDVNQSFLAAVVIYCHKNRSGSNSFHCAQNILVLLWISFFLVVHGTDYLRMIYKSFGRFIQAQRSIFTRILNVFLFLPQKVLHL